MSHTINSKHLKLGLESPASKAIFAKTNELVEKYSETVKFFLIHVAVPCLICPKLIISVFIYFTTDVGNDAFDLPLRMWSV